MQGESMYQRCIDIRLEECHQGHELPLVTIGRTFDPLDLFIGHLLWEIIEDCFDPLLDLFTGHLYNVK